MMVPRRQFITLGTLAATTASVGWPRRVAVAQGAVQAWMRQALQGRVPPAQVEPLMAGAPDTPSWRALATQSLDAARQAGAQYADVRFRVARTEQWQIFLGTEYPAPETSIRVGVGVRALVNGYWGFAGATGVATPDAMARLGADAVAQANVVAHGAPRTVELAPAAVVADGQWTMPVRIDPFTVPWSEKVDFIDGISEWIAQRPFGAGTSTQLRFVKEDRSFASTDGTYLTQTVYTTGATMNVSVATDWMTELPGAQRIDFLTPAGAGWEYLLDAPFEARMDTVLDDARRSRRPKPVDIGRYDVVFDAVAMARLLDASLGPATELDRAMGYEANESGTSFLNDPLRMLGTYTLASPLVTVTANRNMPGGAATVQWDEEGVTPDEIPLVTAGTLTDFQTTRESASWLAPAYGARGQAVRSHGCARCDDVTAPPSQGSPNFVLAPAPHDASFDDLVANTAHGYAVKGGMVYADQQALNGTLAGDVVYEIRNGTLGHAIGNASIVWRTPDFWRNVVALGGASSVERVGVERGRDSEHKVPHTVAAVPAKVTQVAVTDAKRRA